MSKPDICRFSKIDYLYEFRLKDGRVERRILNGDKTPIDKSISEWKEVSFAYLSYFKMEHPELKAWLGRHSFRMTYDMN